MKDLPVAQRGVHDMWKMADCFACGAKRGKKLVNWARAFLALFCAFAMTHTVAYAADSAYLPPGSESCGAAKNIVLIFAGGMNRIQWTDKALLPYAAYLDKKGEIKDTFFDTFLFTETTSKKDALYYPWSLSWGRLARKVDWEEIINELFKNGENLDGLNTAAASIARKVPTAPPIKVVLFIPYPDARQTDFGNIDKDGASQNFKKLPDRFKAVQWYLGEVLKKWKEKNFKNVKLVGFYWIAESISQVRKDTLLSSDPELVKMVSEYIHALGYKLFWIPWAQAFGRAEWKNAGIDCAMLQPNYFFEGTSRSIGQAAGDAKRYSMGIEVEFDQRVLKLADFRARYRAYLDGGVEFGYMRDAVKSYYEGSGAILKLYQSEDAEMRKLYDDTYRFVKGTYVK